MSIESKVFQALSTKVELVSQKVEFKLDPISETKEIDNLFNKGTEIRYKAITEAEAKINSAIKEMVTRKSALYNDMLDFSSNYQKLIGESADNTSQVKEYKKSISRADIQIKELSDSVALLNKTK
jgi:hypothetical protein